VSATVWDKFFWSDWSSDKGLRACSYAARGLWIELLCIAAEANPKGFVSVNGRACDAAIVARMTGGETKEVASLLSELEEHGVFSRDDAGAIYSRRMVADDTRYRGSGEKPPTSNEDLFGTQKPEARIQRPEARFHKPDSKGKRARANARHTLPADWKLSNNDFAYAADNGFSQTETIALGDAFSDHHRNKGTLGLDWEAGFRMWVRNEIKFSKNRMVISNGKDRNGTSKVGFSGLAARLRRGIEEKRAAEAATIDGEAFNRGFKE
jgi:hypothetical protein